MSKKNATPKRKLDGAPQESMIFDGEKLSSHPEKKDVGGREKNVTPVSHLRENALVCESLSHMPKLIGSEAGTDEQLKRS